VEALSNLLDPRGSRSPSSIRCCPLTVRANCLSLPFVRPTSFKCFNSVVNCKVVIIHVFLKFLCLPLFFVYYIQVPSSDALTKLILTRIIESATVFIRDKRVPVAVPGTIVARTKCSFGTEQREYHLLQYIIVSL
jgi:hypothetical protein